MNKDIKNAGEQETTLSAQSEANQLKIQAEQGYFAAYFPLADCYFNGKGIKQDYIQAVKWFEQCARHVFSRRAFHGQSIPQQAQCKLADCYFQGHGVEKSPVIAVEWLERAAGQGYEPAQIKLADCYFKGIGVEKNNKQAVEWLEKAANGNRYKEARLAQRKLGFHYLKEENYTEAVKWFEKAVDLRDSRAIRPSPPEAVWETKQPVILKLENNEDIRAKTELGICYYHAKKHDSAYEIFNKLPKQNDCFGDLWSAYLTYLKNKPAAAEKITAFDRLGYLTERLTPLEIESYNQREKDLPNIKVNEKRITDYLHMAAFGLFFPGEETNNEYLDIVRFTFHDDVICLLEHEKSSPAKIILAFYYRYKNEQEISLKLLKQVSQDILANFLLGKYYKNSRPCDATDYFNKVDAEKESFAARKYALNNIQFLVYSAKEELSNIKHQEEIKEKNKRLDEANHRMQRLVEQFTHSLGNVIFPDTIYQVAERLKNNPECRKDVLLLHEAYHSEIIIKLQGELLRQRYANTNPEKFRQFIRSCRRTQNHADKTKSIEDILDYAASRVTARFLNQHYAGLNSIRDNILSKKNVSLDALKQKFEDDILLNKSLRPIAWVNQNLRPIQITEISPLWKKVFILSESHAEALLFGYFSEILFNAFKYAEHDKDEFLTLVFDEKNIDDKMYLTCSWQNPVKDKSPSMLGTGKGLDAIQEDLKQLNNVENPEESLLTSQQKNQFQVTLFFKKDLLVNELPSLKIKRKANVE